MKQIFFGIGLGMLFSFCCIQYGLWDEERESKKALNEWLENYAMGEAYK